MGCGLSSSDVKDNGVLPRSVKDGVNSSTMCRTKLVSVSCLEADCTLIDDMEEKSIDKDLNEAVITAKNNVYSKINTNLCTNVNKTCREDYIKLGMVKEQSVDLNEGIKSHGDMARGIGTTHDHHESSFSRDRRQSRSLSLTSVQYCEFTQQDET